MSNMQFNKYAEAWRAEKKKALMQQMRRHLHQDVPFDYNIRTRQICNMNYKDDEFRYIKDDDRKYSLKQKVYDELLESKALTLKNDLKEYSPKIYNIMLNIQKFMDGKKPTGKILIYSEFRGDAGAEALELVLRSHGYESFNYKDHKKTKSLKYTIISGEEGDEERANNKDIFNETEKNSHFMGGKVIKDEQIYLNGQIRAGRSNEVKDDLIDQLKQLLAKETKLDQLNVWVYIVDLEPSQMVEYGEVLPVSGQEKIWFENLPNKLKKKLKSLES